MKLLSLFSGIGAFEKALDRLEIGYELAGFSEIDKYAVKSYCAIHNTSEAMNLGDITKIDIDKLPNDIDLITYGFPCQDISTCGKQKGMIDEEGKLTRSGLFFEALRLIEATKPKVAIAENVKNLTSKRFASQFQIVLQSLEDAGYNNYWKILNAKDYGIPQNRERVFIVGIRKDVDTGLFKFPEGYPLNLRLKDLLEDVAEEKYYLSQNACNGLIRASERKHKPTWLNLDGISSTIDTRVGALGHYSPYVIERNVQIRQATKKGYVECEVNGVADLSFPNSKTRRGRVQDGGNICPTITAESNGICKIEDCRIRKLTPRECFRLMGFGDNSFEKAAAVNSNTQLYKQAGNSIVVNVLEDIFVNLFKAIPIPICNTNESP